MEVRLNRNGWHRKLQTFVFKNAPLYNSLCPYFWFTVFCGIFTFILPIVPVIKLIKLIFNGSEDLLHLINDHICVPLMDAIISRMDDSMLLQSWATYSSYNFDGQAYYKMTDTEKSDWHFWTNDYANARDLNYKTREKLIKKFVRWKEITPDWKEKIATTREKHKSEYQKRLVEAEKNAMTKRIEMQRLTNIAIEKKNADRANAEKAKQRRQAMFTKIVIYTKWLAYLIVSVVALGVIYGLYSLITWIGAVTPWADVAYIAGIVLWVVVVLAVAAAIIYLIVMLVRKCDISLGDLRFFKKCSIPFVWIWNALTWIYINTLYPICEFLDKYMFIPIVLFFKAIGRGFVFVWDFLKATKDGYCPAIDWVEDKK